jgi:hypothetical protein
LPEGRPASSFLGRDRDAARRTGSAFDRRCVTALERVLARERSEELAVAV